MGFLCSDTALRRDGALGGAMQHVLAAGWAAAGAWCHWSICPALGVQLWSRGCSFSFCRSSPRGLVAQLGLQHGTMGTRPCITAAVASW